VSYDEPELDWVMRTERIAELRIMSRAGGVSVRWDYFDRDSRRSDESEMLITLRSWAERLIRVLEGSASEVCLSLHRVPLESGETGPPGFALDRRDPSRPNESSRPVSELLREALRILPTR
jgi:hypothetical protein